MFLEQTLKRNPQLIETAVALHQSGQLAPDTYVLDVDAILANAATMLKQADALGVKLYAMTKQLGRNPWVAQQLVHLGFAGVVAVDWREALTMAAAGVKLGHVGHLVQIPQAVLPEILAARPEVVTVYSLAKAQAIAQAAQAQRYTQKILLRVLGPEDILYPGQYGGFTLAELPAAAQALKKLAGIAITGVTSFPCLLFNEKTQQVEPTPNVQTVRRAAAILQELGCRVTQLNMPSVTCTATLPQLAQFGGTHGEPGHGLTGTTPLHAVTDQPEIPAYVYVSEISHNLGPISYCYGGGYYRRSHLAAALVGDRFGSLQKLPALPVDAEAIDYHLGLKGNARVGATCIFAFRTQIFVTRSQVALVTGIKQGRPQILGIYDSQGTLLRKGAIF